jgi:hypothetical protein
VEARAIKEGLLEHDTGKEPDELASRLLPFHCPELHPFAKLCPTAADWVIWVIQSTGINTKPSEKPEKGWERPMKIKQKITLEL